MNLPRITQDMGLGDLLKALTKAFAEIIGADKLNLKRRQDIELGASRLILTDTVTGTRYAISIASGVVVLTPL